MTVTVAIRWNAENGPDVVDGVAVYATREKAVKAAKAWINQQNEELNEDIRRQGGTHFVRLNAFREVEDAIYDWHEEIGVLFTDLEVQ